MPIYEYRCAACGHQDDHLQKLADAPLTKCPACGKKKYQKQLTAAGFQLKGSGWYASDFKGGKKESEAEGFRLVLHPAAECFVREAIAAFENESAV